MCFLPLGAYIPISQTQLQAYIQSMLWEEFPGMQGLLLKGLTSSQLYEDSLRLIGRLTPYASCPLFYPSLPLGLPRNIIILLPVFVVNFSHQDELAKQFSELIAQVLFCPLPCMVPVLSTYLCYFRPADRRPGERTVWRVWAPSSRCTPSRATSSPCTCG